MNDSLALTQTGEARPRRTPWPAAFSVLTFMASAMLLSSSAMAQAGGSKPGVDFTNYDVPLYEQITNHIKDKVLARLGAGKNTRDRYFIIPFAYEDSRNDPKLSHSFMTVIRVLADNKQPKLVHGLALRKYQNREFQAFTISWLPHDFATNPHLCVFDGFGSRLIPQWNKCPISIGRDFKLEETIQLAVNIKNAVCMWGPYEIDKEAFDLAVGRLRLLDSGTIKYRADDRLYRKNRVAINCFHAMAGLEELYPNGGFLGTGFKMWGIKGTARVLIEYKNRADIKHLLMEPVDEKKDRFGFVYAPSRDSRSIYNPFKTASAYRQ